MTKVKWQELFPDEFLDRQRQLPLVYLPLGLCEPHGTNAVLGLDLIKSEYLCERAANELGGIVAPSLGYQIHESGYHAPWLAEVVGNVNPLMTGMPPHVMLYFFLYQLRAFNNAGFKVAIVITGHAGGNEEDFRKAANLFMIHANMRVKVYADPELVVGKFSGDHAGKYELSQLQFIKQDWVRENSQSSHINLGRFAAGEDADEASVKMGEQIFAESLLFLQSEIEELRNGFAHQADKNWELDYMQTETIWKDLYQRKNEWKSASLHAGQTPAIENSIWKKYEHLSL